ncbi:MAG: hypothetical protein JF606_28070 [Burkholderiales bacterium]|nr:hypothetical protein [Burkholderiales bacterium]
MSGAPESRGPRGYRPNRATQAHPPEDRVPGQHPRPGVWRKAATVIASCGIALLLALGTAVLVLRFAGDAQHAAMALHALRPWLISAQVTTLGLLWHHWPGVVVRLGRWRRLSPAVQRALLQGRTRIFLWLAACELLIVLRALSSAAGTDL